MAATAEWMTYGHLGADCLYTGISSGPNARYRVWESRYLFRPHRSTTYVDAAYSYLPSSVVCRSVTLVSPAKTAELIEMPF